MNEAYELVAQPIHYRSKFAPLLRLLDSDDDLDVLAEEDGYSREIGREYRDVRRRMMRGYLLDLEREFKRLYFEASGIAIRNPEIAKMLAGMEESLRIVRRQILFRAWLEAVLPIPGPSGEISLSLRLARRLIPTPEDSVSLLVSMTAIRNAMGAPARVA